MNKIVIGVIFVLGLAFLIGGAVFVGIFPGILKNKINEEVPLIEGSDAYDRWKNTKVPISMKFHFFELTNADNYTSLDDIVLKEKGPFVYDEKRYKNVTEINDDSIEYVEHKEFTFKPGQILNESEPIYFVNFPIFGVLQSKMTGLGAIILSVFQKAYEVGKTDETDLFFKRAPVDILFDGVFYKVFKELKGWITLLKLKGLEINSKYSVYDTKHQVEKDWTINTGKNEVSKIGQLQRFDNMTELTNNPGLEKYVKWIWRQPIKNTSDTFPKCNDLKGTDGTFFAPAISKDDILYAFEPQLCRSVYFHFWKETEVRGIDTLRFKVDPHFYTNPFTDEKNMCYCIEVDKTKCNRSGLLDVSHCIRRSLGAPIIMSAPYFIHADDNLRTQFNHKLEPNNPLNDDNYGTFVDIEPLTGTVLKAVRRLQMSVKIKKVANDKMPQIQNSKNHDEYVVPVFWIEESGEANEEQADLFKSMVVNKKKLANGLSITFIVVGALMAIVSIYLFMRNK